MSRTRALLSPVLQFIFSFFLVDLNKLGQLYGFRALRRPPNKSRTLPRDIEGGELTLLKLTPHLEQ